MEVTLVRDKIYVEYRNEFSGYLIYFFGKLCEHELAKFLNQRFKGNHYSNLLIDLSCVELELTVSEIPDFIDFISEFIISCVDRRIALVCSGTFETAFSILLGKELFSKGLHSQVFSYESNAVSWLVRQ